MIVCSCNVVTDNEIRDVITSFLDEDEWQLVTPGKVYHAMAQRGRCCGCFPGVIDIIVSTTEVYHRRKQTPDAQIIPFIQKIRTEHERCETFRKISRIHKSVAA
ncbi:MAG: (2Fe-2S)-binding protein [Hyphomicrobiales bacterium]